MRNLRTADGIEGNIDGESTGDDDRQIWPNRPHLVHKLDAGHAWHLKVGDQYVEVIRGGSKTVECGLGMRGRGHFEALPRQQDLYRMGDQFLVVDEQHSLAAAGVAGRSLFVGCRGGARVGW